jgi:hypothetical protein
VEELSTLAHGRLQDVKVIVHYTMVASEEDWAKFMTDAQAMETMQGLLVVAGGAKLEVDQRNDIRALYDKHKMKIGVLSDSRITRGVITALGWFGIPVRAFRLDDIGGLLAHLGRESLLEGVQQALAPFIGKSYDDSKVDMKIQVP